MYIHSFPPMPSRTNASTPQLPLLHSIQLLFRDLQVVRGVDSLYVPYSLLYIFFTSSLLDHSISNILYLFHHSLTRLILSCICHCINCHSSYSSSCFTVLEHLPPLPMLMLQVELHFTADCIDSPQRLY